VKKNLLCRDAKNALQLDKIRSSLNARFHGFVMLVCHHIKTTNTITSS